MLRRPSWACWACRPRRQPGRFLSESTNLAALPGAGAPAVRATLKVVCRPARKARVPLRVRMGPAGWSFRLTQADGKGKVLATSAHRRDLLTSVQVGQRRRFAASVVAASGRTGPPTTVGLTTTNRGCRR